ncbi:MAG: EamA family transporter [Crocinitomicaceae bacterium]|nr:EamA family transporter [Flavobacteriales bacterium]NQZ37470.1 EamA family transporter [Crocinitomicaceae bacterium]
MIPLLLSVLSSSLIFVIFKLFKRYGIDTFQAIVVNYFTAFTIGFTLYGHSWNPACLEQTSWMYFAGICALLFIGLFLIMGKSSQLNGVASTSIAVKMSMAISLIFMIIGYGESVTLLKTIGIGLAFVGVYLVSKPSKSESNQTSALWMLIVLFFGSGALDFILNYVQNTQLDLLKDSLFSAIGFGLAGILGLSILIVRYILGKSKFQFKNIIAGIILGIPNYFSIYLLLRSYETTGWDDSTVLAITNVSVVLLSAVIGFTAFKESTTTQKIIGLVSAVFAICVLYIAN